MNETIALPKSASPVAVITGGGRGIGRATAIELASAGYQLAIISRTESELIETARLCGEGALALAGDVSDPIEVDRMVGLILGRMGRVDALVHCAGVAPSATIEQMTIEQWQSIINTNLSPIIYFCRLLWPVWRRQGGGVAVNVSSYAARDPFPGIGAYGAAKAGVNLLGLSLAREGAPINVRVHTVAPAATETTMLRKLFAADQIPSDQTLDPADVARTIAQCIRGDLKHTSGEVIYIHK